ncbi:MAG: type II toxin-antitoxin system VapB family antitoxin [Nitrospirota bacterium]
MNCFEKASRLTGIKKKTALVRLGLEALIAGQIRGSNEL